ncbi:MAG TPA: hypothetical protein ENN75_02025 [candidate division Zixibacteria bacterium]|nr:hypothetical protein [candidate division Zixibacteria bacterium]
MEKAVIIIIVVFVAGLSAVGWLEMSKKRKIRKGVKLILRWFDFIVRYPDDYDIIKIRELGDKVDEYFAQSSIGATLMYFAPKLEKYIADRFGKEKGETDSEAFARLATWEGDTVKLEVYWTLIRGNFAEYIALKEKGEKPDFVTVSAPISILRRYWRI